MLHIITNPTSLDSCLEIASAKHDEILLIQDAVYKATEDHRMITFAVESDVILRGLTDVISSEVKLITYEEFVDLIVKHETNITWR
tara:strand:- start:4 stop:261 length:258 start_codon:yes stop_codon:yes gene_type:complete